MRGAVASPDLVAERLPAILTRLIETTERGEIQWETAAPPDAFAVTVADVRFRVRSRDGNSMAPFILEFLGGGVVPAVAPPRMTGGEPDELDPLIPRLYHVARQDVIGSTPDPFVSVERALGLEPPTSEN
jgi:hypothetical protein